MLKMTDVSQEFLKKHLPKVLEEDDINDALDLLSDFIDEYGFESPLYERFNDLGREAQRVYDDIYISNE